MEGDHCHDWHRTSFNIGTTFLYVCYWYGVLGIHTASLFVTTYFLCQGHSRLPVRARHVIKVGVGAFVAVPIVATITYITMRCDDTKSWCALEVFGALDIIWVVLATVPVSLYCSIRFLVYHLQKHRELAFNPDIENRVRIYPPIALLGIFSSILGAIRTSCAHAANQATSRLRHD